MSPLWHQIRIGLLLHLRNKMALIYSYLFPTIFLVAFWVLYRFEQVPLVRHMGELLTVTALGGACFGLPTTIVSERERGVWRRYKLTPVPTATLLSGTFAARYVLLIGAGLLQLVLAMTIGMPAPRHPFDLFVAFTCVSIAFIGLGLVIAMMADNVPAVQALGQCIFLPMLIIGGVAVPLTTLPEWAQRLSSFFPGRYAVEAIQATVNGDGLSATTFSVLALLLIGAGGILAGIMMFRWDGQQRFVSLPRKGWLAAALASWLVVGVAAETRRRAETAERMAARTAAATETPPAVAESSPEPEPAPAVAPVPQLPKPVPPVPPRPERTERAGDVTSRAAASPATTTPTAPERPSTPPSEPAVPAPAPSPPTAPASGSGKPPATWREVTLADIERDLIFTRLPPDDGVVTPIARLDEEPEPGIYEQVEKLRFALPSWKPGQVDDPVQRVRNLLYVAAVPDVFQMSELERFIPLVIYDYIQQEVPKDDLIKILYWIALHPFEGDDKAVDELRPLGLFNGPADMETTRDRTSVYGVKLLGRVMGKLKVE